MKKMVKVRRLKLRAQEQWERQNGIVILEKERERLKNDYVAKWLRKAEKKRRDPTSNRHSGIG
jgi:hypothetical protein